MATTLELYELPIIAGTKAAALLGLSYSSVVALANLGDLPCMKDSAGRRLYKRCDIDKLIAERKAGKRAIRR